MRWSRDIDRQIDFRLTGLGRPYGPPTSSRGAHRYLYRNKGGGRFTEVARPTGLAVDNPATGEPMAVGLGQGGV